MTTTLITTADAIQTIKDHHQPYVNPDTIAQALGYSVESIYTLKYQDKMPPEEMNQSNVPLWKKATIVKWIRETGRPKQGRPKTS